MIIPMPLSSRRATGSPPVASTLSRRSQFEQVEKVICIKVTGKKIMCIKT
jgi:hypothetical protein